MYVVRFVRKDGQPDEEYYYNCLKDAQFHFNLFKDDDSGLYKNISLSQFFQTSSSSKSKLIIGQIIVDIK